MEQAFIGVDVGTASARAGCSRRRHAAGDSAPADRDLARGWRIVEQSSADIWTSLHRGRPCRARGSGSIAVDASRESVSTRPARWWCWTAAEIRSASAAPATASRNIIVWMDHRAIPQADRINETGDECCATSAAIISPEMETPKLLWLKEHLPATYHARRTVLRSRRLSHLSRDRQNHAVDVHVDLQMDIPRP